MENVPMKEYTLQMNPGDRLFVYTDGVPEAIDRDEKAYGTERLVAKLNELREEPQKGEVCEGSGAVRRHHDAGIHLHRRWSGRRVNYLIP